MSSELPGSLSAHLEHISHLSPDQAEDVCSRVEKVLTSAGREMGETDGMPREEAALIFILTELIKSKCRSGEAELMLNNIFKDQLTSRQVLQFFNSVSAKERLIYLITLKPNLLTRLN